MGGCFIITHLAHTHFPFPPAPPKSSVNTETVTLESWQTGFQCSLSIMGEVINAKWKGDEEEVKAVIVKGGQGEG